MAVTEAEPTIKVEIISNSVPLQEYVDNDEDTADEKVTKYIEAVSGAQFEVLCTVTRKPKTDILVALEIDGKFIPGKFLMLEDFKSPISRVQIKDIKHAVGKDWYTSNFSFSSLNIADSDLTSINDRQLKMIKQVGIITVKVIAVKNMRPSVENMTSCDLGDIGVVPEKALKGRALSHSANLQGSRKSKGCEVLTWDHVNPSREPLSTYNFRYRSREALKSLLVIPRSPSPVPLEERDIDSLNTEEMRELLRQQQQRDRQAQVKVERVKRERVPDGEPTMGAEDDDEIVVVSEKRRKLRVSVDDNGQEVIDLT